MKRSWSRSLMQVLLSLALVGSSTTALGQSLWLESGLAYHEAASGSYESGLKLGLRGTIPLTDVAGLYGTVGLQHGFTVGAGGWFSFRPNPEDPFGLRSYLGAGLGYAGGDIGLALTAALSYDVTRDLALTLSYTHRPIILPRLSQRFDIAAGIRIGFD